MESLAWICVSGVSALALGGSIGFLFYWRSLRPSCRSSQGSSHELEAQLRDWESRMKVLETEWEEVFDKFRSLIGRAERAKRKDRPSGPSVLRGGEGDFPLDGEETRAPG